LVGAEGFEPPTPCSQSRCATRLRYAPRSSLLARRLERNAPAWYEPSREASIAARACTHPRPRKTKRAPKHPFHPHLARPERFELPTTKFVAWYSIQLSYGREEAKLCGAAATPSTGRRSLRAQSTRRRDARPSRARLAEREGFEPSIELLTLYSLSRGAPSASRASLRVLSRRTRTRHAVAASGNTPRTGDRRVPATIRRTHAGPNARITRGGDRRKRRPQAPALSCGGKPPSCSRLMRW
jgi:hypothetical protein